MDEIKPKRGRCRECGRELLITSGGNIWPHGSKLPGVWPPQTCLGAGKPPADDDDGLAGVLAVIL